MDIQTPQASKTEGHGVLYLTISVFLVILSFFIMINAISTRNAGKAENIARSVSQEFGKASLSDKLVVFDQQQQGVTVYGGDKMRDVISGFITANKQNADMSLTETAAAHIIKVKLISLFGPGNSKYRPAAETLIAATDALAGEHRKNPTAKAQIVVPYDPSGRRTAERRATNLHAMVTEKAYGNIDISTVSDGFAGDKMEDIYIVFDRNGF